MLVFNCEQTHAAQVVIAFITTAVFALQLVALDRLRADMWGATCEGLAIVVAFLSAKQAGAFTCNRWRISGHHDHCASVTALCVFSVLIMYFPFGLYEMWRSACFCFCLLGLPAEMLWFGKRKGTTRSTADPSMPYLDPEELNVESGDKALVHGPRYDPDVWGRAPTPAALGGSSSVSEDPSVVDYDACKQLLCQLDPVDLRARLDASPWTHADMRQSWLKEAAAAFSIRLRKGVGVKERRVKGKSEVVEEVMQAVCKYRAQGAHVLPNRRYSIEFWGTPDMASSLLNVPVRRAATGSRNSLPLSLSAQR